MRYIIGICTWLAWVSFPVFAFGQDAENSVSIGPPASWVEEIDTPAEDFALAADRTHVYNLVSRQRRHSKETSVNYFRYRESFKTVAAVEDNAKISVEVDPSFETLTFHHIRIERGGERIEHVNDAEFAVYRVEKDRDELIYNKVVEVSYFMPDLRAGDTLDYAFTVTGRNPAIGPHMSQRSQLQYRPPVQRLFDRTVFANDLTFYASLPADAPTPDIVETELATEYRWDRVNLESKVIEDNRPYWDWGYPNVVFSTFKDWHEIGDFFAQYYVPPDRLPPALIEEVSRIRDTYTDKKAQTRAALDFVQKHIRYLALNFGAGGYIPRQPKHVLERRFGDCKDVTLLLITLLNALDIPSAPILVDTDYRGEIDRLTPHHTVFDHIVVRATVDGKDYFLDATRGEQLGTLDTMAQANYGKGLEVKSPSVGLVSMNSQPYPWDVIFTSVFDIIDDTAAVDFTMTMQFFGGRADGVKNWIEREGMATILREYRDYYLNRYPSLEAAGEPSVVINDDAALLELTLRYLIKEAWTHEDGDTTEDFNAFPREINDDIPAFSGKKRLSPFYLRHPVRTKETQIFKLDNTWDIKPDDYTEENDSFSFARKERFDDGVFKIDYEYRTHKDHITPQTYPAIMKSLDTINDDLGTSLYRPIDGADTADTSADDEDLTTLELAILIAIGLALSALLIYLAVLSARKDLEWRHEAVFYPVKLPVFILMTFITFGVYIVYWLFKNWQWTRSIQKADVFPIWCTLFSTITSLFLFLRIGRYPHAQKNWFLWIAVPLGILNLLTDIVTNFMDDTWGLGLGLVSLSIFIAPAARVLQLNSAAPHIVERYSEFGWEKVVSIIIGTLCYVIIGLLIYAGEF